jgi:hypothetical protein
MWVIMFLVMWLSCLFGCESPCFFERGGHVPCDVNGHVSGDVGGHVSWDVGGHVSCDVVASLVGMCAAMFLGLWRACPFFGCG